MAGGASGAEFIATFNTLQEVDAAFTRSTWTGTNRTHSAANVTVNNGILQLKLNASPPGTLPVCAEIVSRKNDFFHGTYRASIKMTNRPGAVVGFFTYLGNPLNEIDIEFLTRTPRTAYFTLHHVQTNVDDTTRTVAFDPSAAFHEYRFDWYASRIDFYIDNQLMATLTNQVPNLASSLLINHWSGNIAGWGGAAPVEDVFMDVDWVYYNSDYSAPPFLTILQPRFPRGAAAPHSPEYLVPAGGRILVARKNRLYSLAGESVVSAGVDTRYNPMKSLPFSRQE
jgi:beta-glucanase (GH16 family)